MRNIKRILVPVDFSACSKAALEYAVMIGEGFQAAIEVLSVWHTPALVAPDLLVTLPDRPAQSVSDWVRGDAEVTMDGFLKDVADSTKLEITSRLEAGAAFETIVRIAKEDDFDLIVMGTHGRTGLSHMLLGSVAEKVVRLASCPVLTIRVRD